MRGLAILLLFNYAGVVLHEQAHVPLPGNVLGFALLTAALFARIIKVEWVEETSELFIRHLPLLFSPSIVAAAALVPFLAPEWPAVLIGMLGSMVATLVLTGWSVQFAAGGHTTRKGA
jgi:holin-like protein